MPKADKILQALSILILGIASSFLIIKFPPIYSCAIVFLMALVFLSIANPYKFLILIILIKPIMIVFELENSTIPAIFDTNITISLDAFVSMTIIMITILYLLINRSSEFFNYSLTKIFLLFIIYCSFGIFLTQYPLEFYKKFGRLVSILALYIIILNLINDEIKIKTAEKAMLLCCLIVIILGFSYFLFTGFDKLAIDRVANIGVNNFGLLMTYILLFITGYLMTGERCLISKWALYLMSAAGLVLLIFCACRSAWIGLALGLFAQFFFLRNKKFPLKLLIVFLFIIILFLPEIGRRVEDLKGTSFKPYGAYYHNSLESRMFVYWPASYRVFLRSPIVGHGLGSYLYLNYIFEGVNRSSHNDYLAILVDTGVIGFSLFIILLIALFKPIFRMLKQEVISKYYSLFLGATGISIAFLEVSLFDGTFYGGGASSFFFLTIFLLHAAFLVNKES